MSYPQKAKVTAVRTKERPDIFIEKTEEKGYPWVEEKRTFADRLLRNMTLAAALLICLAAVRAMDEQPAARAVFQTVQEQVSLDLDESLGRLTFVSNMLPEAAMVFWEPQQSIQVNAPMEGEVAHVWSPNEPFLAIHGDKKDVCCGAEGEVMSIAWDDAHHQTIRVRHPNDLETLYGNLSACFVKEGDVVLQNDLLGQVAQGKPLIFEVRRQGRSIDPTVVLEGREGKP